MTNHRPHHRVDRPEKARDAVQGEAGDAARREENSYGDLQRQQAHSGSAPFGGNAGAHPFSHQTATRQAAEGELPEENLRGMTLTHEDAVAGSPEDESVAGEEDAGVGLEFMVNRRQRKEH